MKNVDFPENYSVTTNETIFKQADYKQWRLIYHNELYKNTLCIIL